MKGGAWRAAKTVLIRTRAAPAIALVGSSHNVSITPAEMATRHAASVLEGTCGGEAGGAGYGARASAEGESSVCVSAVLTLRSMHTPKSATHTGIDARITCARSAGQGECVHSAHKV